MGDETRVAFHRDLDEIDQKVVQLFALVSEGVGAATDAFLAGDAYVDRDGEVAVRLNERDDELDELHVSLTAELVAGQLTVPVALEMALVARFYERLGDHAVNIAERISYIAEGP